MKMAAPTQSEFETLLLLLKAPSKEVVLQLCDAAYTHRDTHPVPPTVTGNVSTKLDITDSEAQQLMNSLAKLVKKAIYEGCSDLPSAQAIFPESFHKNLKDLLSKIITERSESWRNYIINSEITMPKLVDFDWRVDLKMASETVSRMSVPTCLLQLQVQDNLDQSSTAPVTSFHSVELSKGTLDTMLDGLGKICDQLSSVSRK
ncbi:PREDICTED: COMM domain-containing protein 9-like [Priapulus caudatus]|uniref:COMM domain-containing protein 9-like n=1 Tax=Priapulus caudatus TaxID=37621 RepID=A0ABM1DRV2_PRICU|nr:PREDICTED: COMM domain-containing protein 9-like [Priapulus caudatus]